MRRGVLVGLVAVSLLAGCDAVVKRTLPDAVHTLSIEPFQNLGDQSQLPGLLADEMRRSFRLDGRLAITDHRAGAQSVLGGTIAVYDKVPSRYDRNNIVQEYRLLIGVDLVLTDPGTGKTLWPAAVVSATVLADGVAPPPVAKPAAHRLSTSVTFTVVPASGLPVETEEDAQRRAVRDLAEETVHKVIEGW
jgi:hypothetical protein